MADNPVVARLVVRQGEDYAVDDDGILVPDDWWSASGTQLALSDFEQEQSFVLLGEPGIGKSTAIRSHVGSGPAVTHIDLDEITDIGQLQQRLAAAGSRPSGETTTLVLDGLDECPLAPKAVTRHLLNFIGGAINLRVVVGCRTSDWYEPLASGLRKTLGRCDVLELLPLAVKDIERLAESRGCNGANFVQSVRDNSVGALAGIPLTLDLLLRIFVKQGGLPDDPSDLYEQGLRELAREPDPGRTLTSRTTASSAECLAAAARISSILMLCGGSAVATGATNDALAIRMDDLVGGSEPSTGGDVAITGELISAALGTAMFTGRGAGRLGVRHASFAAYLCARYLADHQLPEHQLRALLTRASAIGRVSIPTRLRETAAWLLARDPGRYGWIVSVDPEAVVAHSPVVPDSRIRSLLVEFLLTDPDRAHRMSKRRWRLRHDGLRAQLGVPLRRPLEQDTGAHLGNPVARAAHTALQIARASRLVEASPEIAQLVARAGLNPVLRASAAHALVDLDQARAAAVLRGVLTEIQLHPAHDPDNELRGLALRTCWPGALSADELVAALRRPNDSDLIGDFSMFVSSLVEKASEPQVVDILRALWRASRTSGQPIAAGEAASSESAELNLLTGSRRERALATALLERVVAHERLAEMIPEASWLLAACSRRYETVQLPLRFYQPDSKELDASRNLRRRLVEGALGYISAQRSPMLLWRWTRPVDEGVVAPRGGLLDGEDLEWLFDIAKDPKRSDHCAALISALFDPANPRQQEIAWSQREHPLFASTVGRWFAAVDLDGEEAAQQRENHRFLSETPTWDGASDHQTVVVDAWERLMNTPSDGNAFVEVCRLLWTDPNFGNLELPQGAIQDWPGLPLVEFDEERFLASAVDFLRTHKPNAEHWVTTPNSISLAAFAGYSALCEVAPTAGGVIAELSDEQIAEWAAVVIRWPFRMMPDFAELHERLSREVHERAPNQYRRAYLDWVLVNFRAGEVLPDLEVLVDDFTSEEVDEIVALLEPAIATSGRASRMGVSTETREAITGTPDELLHAHDTLRALIAFVSKTDRWSSLNVGFSDTTSGERPQTSAVLATGLLESDPGEWPRIFAEMRANSRFGYAMALEASREPSGQPKPWWTRLSSDELGNLAAWLLDQWGLDYVADGFGGPEDRIRDWRDGILNVLAERSTSHSLAQLARLSDLHPNFYRLKDLLFESEARQRDEAWRGPTSAELAALVRDSNRTIVSDEDDLYRIVLAALERFSARLNHIGQLLWNETRSAAVNDPESRTKKVWAPKYESDISAVLADHLDSEFGRGLVVNREVLVRQTSSKGHGLAVDILVSNSAPGTKAPRFSIPIEVKGSWNRQLFEDMDQQLVVDYMPALGAHRGIFICAWFPPTEWTDLDDSRRVTALQRTHAATEAELNRQADQASSGGVQVAAVVVPVPRPRPSSRATQRS